MRHCRIQCNFGGYWRFMQIRQRIFNCTDMQIMNFILDKILKLLTYYTPFHYQPLQNYLISKTVRFFGPPCIIPSGSPGLHILQFRIQGSNSNIMKYAIKRKSAAVKNINEIWISLILCDHKYRYWQRRYRPIPTSLLFTSGRWSWRQWTCFIKYSLVLSSSFVKHQGYVVRGNDFYDLM